MDIASMLKQLQAQKPPVDCPICGKQYRSFSGISYHVVKFHANGQVSSQTLAADIAKITSQVKKQPLSYAEAQRMVEFDIKGSIFRNLITEPLQIELEIENEEAVEKVEAEAKPVLVSKCPVRSTPHKKKRGRGSRFVHYKHRYADLVKRSLVGVEEKPPALPIASFSIIPDEEVIETQVPERGSYYRFIEKSTDELDEEVEYGMDEEDYIWLEQVNEERRENNLSYVSQEIFELLMDRLEKESHFESRTVTGDPYNLIDEDAVCSICVDGECSNSNVILFCDMCNLAVHQECYGVPYIPEGQWLCRKCLQSPSKPVDCVLCPTKSGAFKQTDTCEWAHVVCALWIPEVCFANTVFLEPIDSVSNIPSARWKLTCYICKKKEGACIQCFKSNCYTAFHVTCAQQGGLYMKIEPGRTETGQPTVKKSAFCDVHMPKHRHTGDIGTPSNSDYCSEEESDTGSLNSPLLVHVQGKSMSSPVHQTPSAKLKEVQKKLLEKESFKLPAVHIPFVPAHRLSKIVVKVAIQKKSQFIQQLQSYWMLKRQSRNGVPLLRRLQVNTGSGTSRNQREELTIEEWSQSKELKEQLRYWQQLRHDLERVRLLIELIRKREKVKKDQYRMKQQVVAMQLKPLQLEMERTLMLLQERDTSGIFAEPVKAEDAPDYHEFISSPMDFSTMRQKLSDYEYLNFDLFERDFKTIIQNCLDFNKEDTIYYRAAVRMRAQCKPIIHSAKKRIKQAGIDPLTGMHMEKPPHIPGEVSSLNENDVSSIIDNPFMTIDEKVEDLEQKLDESIHIKNALSRLARQKLLRKEIAKLRRKKRKMDNGQEKSYTEQENAQGEEQSIFPKKRGRKRKNGHNESLHLTEYNGEVKVEPDHLPLELRYDSPSSQIHPLHEHGDINFDLLSQTVDETGKVARNPSPGRSRRSGILFKKKQYQPTKPSPLVLYSSEPSEDDQNGKSLKIRLRLEHNSNKKKSFNDNRDRKTDNMNKTKNDVIRLKDSLNGYSNGDIHETENDDCLLTDDIETENFSDMLGYSARKRTYTSSSANSDSEETATATQKKSHKRGRQKSNTKLSLKQEFSDLEGINDIKYGIYMVYSDESNLLDPKCHPETLDMLTLIWAKCRGYPSYPALTMDPNLPPGGYQANGVPIPIPTKEILQMNDDHQKYLILFFDARRTWQWLPREKIEPLGVDSRLDEVKLIESRKPSMRKNVQEAYKRAISFRRRLEVGEKGSESEDDINHTNLHINGTSELEENAGDDEDDSIDQFSSIEKSFSTE